MRQTIWEPWCLFRGLHREQVRMVVDSRQCVVTLPADNADPACLALRRTPHAGRARQSFDTPPGGISLGAHRKGQAGVCQREQRVRGFQSQQECAGGCALAGELASGLGVSVLRPAGCLVGLGEVVPQGRDDGEARQGRAGPSTGRVAFVVPPGMTCLS